MTEIERRLRDAFTAEAERLVPIVDTSAGDWLLEQYDAAVAAYGASEEWRHRYLNHKPTPVPTGESARQRPRDYSVDMTDFTVHDVPPVHATYDLDEAWGYA